MDKLDQSTLESAVSGLSKIADSLSNFTPLALANEQQQTSSVSINNSGWVIGVSIGACILATVVTILSAFFFRAEITDLKNEIHNQSQLSKQEVGQIKQEVLIRVTAIESDLKRSNDRNQDYFGMHMNAINQVRAKLDLKLIEPLPKKNEKETKE